MKDKNMIENSYKCDMHLHLHWLGITPKMIHVLFFGPLHFCVYLYFLTQHVTTCTQVQLSPLSTENRAGSKDGGNCIGMTV